MNYRGNASIAPSACRPQGSTLHVTAVCEREVPEQALGAMQQAIIEMLQTLPTPIIITEHQDTQQQTYYPYQVGEQTEDHPFGIAMGATPEFLDAMRFSRSGYKAEQRRPRQRLGYSMTAEKNIPVA